jgi:3',5'-cyclic AMP phosphodiesterase CpdA
MIIAADIHIKKAPAAALTQLVGACLADPHRVLIIAGDLTQHGRKWEYDTVREFLERLLSNEVQIICTPGNHDLSLLKGVLPGIRGKRRRRYRRSIVDLLAAQPAVVACNTFDIVMDLGPDVLVSLRSVHRSGYNRIQRSQIDWAAAFLQHLEGRRVHLITHHSYWTLDGDRHGHLHRRGRLARELLSPCGVRTYINGHNHRFAVGREATRGTPHEIDHIQAPTLSRRSVEFQRGFVQWDPAVPQSARLVPV